MARYQRLKGTFLAITAATNIAVFARAALAEEPLVLKPVQKVEFTSQKTNNGDEEAQAAFFVTITIASLLGLGYFMTSKRSLLGENKVDDGNSKD